MKRTFIKLTIAINNKIAEFNAVSDPKEGNIIETLEYGAIKLVSVKMHYEYNDENKQVRHFICTAKQVNENMVGVRQVKFIMGNSYDDIERKLNEFLNETKFTHTIENITHANAYVAVQYKLKNKQDIWVAENSLKSYQEK